MKNNFNAQDLQISLLSSKQARELNPKLVFWIHIAAWFLAISSCIYAVAIIGFYYGEIQSFAVSESGDVFKLETIEPAKLRNLMSRAKANE